MRGFGFRGSGFRVQGSGVLCRTSGRLAALFQAEAKNLPRHNLFFRYGFLILSISQLKAS